MPRRSDLAFVLPKLRIAQADYFLLHWHVKWCDWSLVGGHVEPGEEGNWLDTAVREANEEFAPLRSGADFTVDRQPLQRLEWGPVPSRSHSNAPTIYRAEYYGLQFVTDPLQALRRLPASAFSLVPTSAWHSPAYDVSDTIGRLCAALAGAAAIPLSWSGELRMEQVPRLLLKQRAAHAAG